MSTKIHEIDPEGDVWFILRDPDAPFALWGDDQEMPSATNRPFPKFGQPEDEKMLFFRSFEPKTAAFGSSTGSGSGSGFGANSGPFGRPAFGSSSPSGFGSGTTPAFGSSSGTGFGSVAAPPLGSSPQPAFGSVAASPLGSSPQPAFGSVAAPAYTFGLPARPAPSQQQPEPADSQNATSDDDGADADENAEVRIRVSSKHLMLASEYFKKALAGTWKESQGSSLSHEVHASEWNVEATLILMNIIHGRNRSVPRSVSLEMLAQVALLVDYYNCHEVFEFYADCWINSLRGAHPVSYNRDLVLWLFVSRMFSKETLFMKFTKTAIKDTKGRLDTLGLPIPTKLVECIDQKRQECIGQIVSRLHDLLLYLHKRGSTSCSEECSSMMLGTLARHMHASVFIDPAPTKPFRGYSLLSTKYILSAWKTLDVPGKTQYNHSCSLEMYLKPVYGVVDNLEGLNLDDFKS